MTNLECAGLPGPPGPTGWAQKGDRGEAGSKVSEYFHLAEDLLVIWLRRPQIDYVST